ncbi:unnamed protein product [Darwinula stevensoni]|uniref:Reelin domain-containing protein n=1 Tax=Darwinula stevensoni TaxID=69355 RepID=A0A7R8X3U6_9CRUS|nr:unnamed protein product [Darwinula stevensoni]CAG0884770.1 unnamed protein product [Darwinula stevensoni]
MGRGSGGQLALTLCCVLGSLWFTWGFPDGAPIEACILDNPNRPNHGYAPQDTRVNPSPYLVVASNYVYQPGEKIEVVIANHPFQGFFLQARDIDTNKWIEGGQFLAGKGIQPIPECSAVTHSDKLQKPGLRLVWEPPQGKKGFVYFTGTVLQNYTTFWSDIIALVPDPNRQRG